MTEVCPSNSTDDDFVDMITPVVTICFGLIGVTGFIG